MMTIPTILDKVGDTPLVSLKLDGYENINFLVKNEAFNPTGSVKDRAASFILKKLLMNGTINYDTTIIESTSGNFGVSLSAFCKYNRLRFVAIVDPQITPINEMLISSSGAEIIKVNEPDQYGGYLLNRLKKTKELNVSIQNSYWVNQYENPLISEAYYLSLGKEITYEVDEIDYVFLGVSSGGTIAGVSRKVKESFPTAKIIAVDVMGSRIFSDSTGKKRSIPGIGSSIRPKILKQAIIDEVVIVDEAATIEACHELLTKYNYFSGGSSGSVFAAVKKYFKKKLLSGLVNVISVFPDRGERYFDTIYNHEWVEKIKILNRPVEMTNQ